MVRWQGRLSFNQISLSPYTYSIATVMLKYGVGFRSSPWKLHGEKMHVIVSLLTWHWCTASFFVCFWFNNREKRCSMGIQAWFSGYAHNWPSGTATFRNSTWWKFTSIFVAMMLFYRVYRTTNSKLGLVPVWNWWIPQFSEIHYADSWNYSYPRRLGCVKR